MKQPDEAPWFNELLDGSVLSPETQLQAAEDPELAWKINWARTWLSDLQDLRGIEPPEEVVRRAKQLLPRSGLLGGAWRRLLATLQLDSAHAQLAPVRRASQDGLTRLLRYQAENYQIELSSEETVEGKIQVSGKLQPADEAPFAVFFQPTAAASVQTAWSDASGYFFLSNLVPGQYALKIELDDLELFLPQVPLSREEP